VSPSRKRRAVELVRDEHDVSERRACRVVGHARSTQRYQSKRIVKDGALVEELRALALKHPRFGYRRATALLRRQGWRVNTKRVQRLRRAHGLQVPRRQIKRRRLGHSKNACSRFVATHPNHVWSVDFVSDQTEDGERLKVLVVVDEYTRECLSLLTARSITGNDVGAELERLIWLRGKPGHIRADNGPEFIANAVRKYLADESVGTLYIAPGSPWENGYVESFNSKFRDEFLAREVFGNLREAEVLIRGFRTHYNAERPHSALKYMTPRQFADDYKKTNHQSREQS
jgi:putative transposase